MGGVSPTPLGDLVSWSDEEEEAGGIFVTRSELKGKSRRRFSCMGKDASFISVDDTGGEP